MMILNLIGSQLERLERTTTQQMASERFMKISKKKESSPNRNKDFRIMDKKMDNDKMMMRLKKPYSNEEGQEEHV